ncbi:MAG: ATP-binding protein [Bacteroidia bacterium]
MPLTPWRVREKSNAPWRIVRARLTSISDNGKGIPKNQMKDVFQPGFTTKKRGWGLGLSLAKRIVVDYHSGEIFVKDSIPNKRTTLRVILAAKALSTHV